MGFCFLLDFARKLELDNIGGACMRMETVFFVAGDVASLFGTVGSLFKISG